LTARTGVTAEDVAKRLIDFGFHAPTLSFPVAGTLMVEPTESEDLAEIDRFIEAMIAIRKEIDQVANGDFAVADSPLRHAPHTAAAVVSSDWDRAYPREQAAFPAHHKQDKYFPPVGRIDGAAGDRNLICSCPPLSEFEN
ncbi:glycine dehydrogenase (aminomethyl-transferring), partial [Pseudarthrobacter sp. C4D7]|nr:glycine dehydrogenase (aminomethyl-transferring) [Pseudarthrobacter sp. C4D7]